MFEAIVNGGESLNIDFKGDETQINGRPAKMDVVKTGARSFQILREGKTYKVHVVEVNAEAKTVQLVVNGKKAEVAVTTELDRLLKKMGFENAGAGKVSELKAPMPGLIHSVQAQPGDAVAKGDQLLVLEAMKMENVIKSPADEWWPKSTPKSASPSRKASSSSASNKPRRGIPNCPAHFPRIS